MSSSPAFDQEHMLPVLPAGWRWQSLQDLVDPSRGICYGIVQPGNHDPDGVPMVNSGNVFNGRVTPDVSFRVAVELHRKYERSTLRGGEVLVTLVGANFGQVAIAPIQYTGHNCARPVGVVPILESNRYVMYALQSPLLRQRMDNVANTTAQPTLNLKDLGRLPIPIPPRHTREGIAELLGAFDDRITLLRETNATLEAIAQALFKSWFVDFDPVRAKIAGCAPEGMDEATAALFPDALEETQLGLVPKGWHVASLSECCIKVESGGTPKRTVIEYWNGPFAWLTSGEVRNPIVFQTKETITDDGLKGSAAKLWPEGTTVVAMYGATAGEVCLIASPMTANQACCGLIPRAHSRAFLFFCARRERDSLASKSSGSAQQNLNKGLVEGHPTLLPSDGVVAAFEAVVGSLLDRWIESERHAQTLSNLRDTLLPRLISGQLRLPEAQAELEAAA